MSKKFSVYVRSASTPGNLESRVQEVLNNYAIGDCKVDVKYSSMVDGDFYYTYSALVLIEREV